MLLISARYDTGRVGVDGRCVRRPRLPLEAFAASLDGRV